MKSPWFSILAGTLFIAVSGIAFYLWSNYYRASVEQQAYDLMTASTEAVLGSGDWSLVLENMTPESPIQSADMSSLRSFGRLVDLADMEGVAEVPMPFSGQTATAQLRMTGHFTNGGCVTEAILVHRDGRWLFSHFAYIPGSFAQ